VEEVVVVEVEAVVEEEAGLLLEAQHLPELFLWRRGKSRGRCGTSGLRSSPVSEPWQQR
jgi:hypothetical protein